MLTHSENAVVVKVDTHCDVTDDLELSASRSDELAYHLVDGSRVHLEPVMVLGERRLDHFDLLFQHVQASHYGPSIDHAAQDDQSFSDAQTNVFLQDGRPPTANDRGDGAGPYRANVVTAVSSNHVRCFTGVDRWSSPRCDRANVGIFIVNVRTARRRDYPPTVCVAVVLSSTVFLRSPEIRTGTTNGKY